MFVSPGEITFSFSFISIRYYGIIMALSILVGIASALLITKKFYPELDSDVIYDISPHIIIGAIIGARLYYCFLSWGYFLRNPLEIIQLWHGGMSIHGGILGGLIAGFIYATRHKLPVLKLCDIFSYGLVLGQALGRWGNFFNSEAFGRPTESFLKLYIPIYKRPIAFMQYDYFHPTFFYESILNICIFLLLFFVVRRYTVEKNGAIFFTYLILYSFVRLFVEQLRIDSVFNLAGVPIAQVVSILVILVSLPCLLVILLRKKGNDEKIISKSE